METYGKLLREYVEDPEDTVEEAGCYCDVCGHRIDITDALAKASVLPNEKETDDQSE